MKQGRESKTNIMPKVMEVDLIRSHIKEWAGKKSKLQIAADLGISTTAVQNSATLMRISLEVIEKVERRKNIEKVIKKYHSKMTASQIADLSKESIGIIKYHGEILGLDFKPFRRGPGKINKVKRGCFNEGANTNWLV